MLKIRRLSDRLIFNIGFPALIRWHLYFELGPRKMLLILDWFWHTQRKLTVLLMFSETTLWCPAWSKTTCSEPNTNGSIFDGWHRSQQVSRTPSTAESCYWQGDWALLGGLITTNTDWQSSFACGNDNAGSKIHCPEQKTPQHYLAPGENRPIPNHHHRPSE